VTVDPNADTAELQTPETGIEAPRPFSSLVRVDAAAQSHTGKVRLNNEDHFLIGTAGRYLDVQVTSLPKEEAPVHSEEKAYAFVVADGMGGAQGGEVASELAISTLVNLALHVPDWILRIDNEGAKETIRRATERYQQVDAEIARQASENQKLSGMGTTMTLAYSLGADLFVVHVGDSRAYLFRDGRLRQLTTDHTFAQMLVDMGQVKQVEAPSHPLRHVLIQALGQRAGSLQVQAQRIQLVDGDCLLLCTDGLTEMVSDDLIAEVIGRGENAEDVCRDLVDLALRLGGADNVTVIVGRYHFPVYRQQERRYA